MNLTKQKHKAYLAGPMANCRCRNYEAFFYWAYRLNATLDWDIENPAEYDCKALFKRVRLGFTYPAVLLKDLKIISKCDCIILLPGWENSWGAKTEKAYAEAIGLDIYEVDSENDEIKNITGEKRNTFITND